MEDTNISKLKEKIKSSDAILIGAGSGISTSAGYTYSGERFDKYFSDFKKKYGITDMYSGGFYPFESEEIKWAWWSRHIYYNRYIDIPKDTYKKLFSIVKNKEYFVLTTNVDHCFQRAGFNKQRLFYTQGDYGLLQCAKPCHDNTYDNEEIITKMLNEQKDMKIPSNLIPKCPKCKGLMTTNLRANDHFVEDQGWKDAADRYGEFLDKYEDKKLLLLELGVGYNTPGIIKYPFWKLAFKHKKMFYVCINYSDSDIPREIEDNSLVMTGDIDSILNSVLT